MKVTPIQVTWSDNWMYLIVDEKSKEAAVVDPWDAENISQYVKKEGVKVTSLITTHHHNDHSGGNEKFLSLHPGINAYGGSSKSAGTNVVVGDGDTFKIGNIDVRCMHTPCHTQDSICFFVEDKETDQRGVFTGDTLFLAGCGRFFEEGTPKEMRTALAYLGTLRDDTVVYNGHEYTKGSAKFGLTIEPDNKALQGLLEKAQKDSCTTGKSTIGDEKSWNVFMRLNTPHAKKATGETDPIKVMGKLREMKNAM
ncbi:hypothetical protein TREMEDRAFT_25740 [Tremella mesenterica DSM 1558]|uniref:uncharacterized protein n=1 Tax=Tremella mesenterica (strain ATCC 24925 / CBS 8224 / DSM 1558 / NBRC 9311 / NRRL Y-6157 / RJB 2259-6 / UBC 559-6) TaxID=578456 RepID=UPI0003F491A7|nr:uncharacterized protein TREMEDRAFT_25740 [Tremella mesenterica DSM 1558]EIW73671.1 hypothetical protein TREMEDRAFT_25740 [Tremella mesenterica DSM 1558]